MTRENQVIKVREKYKKYCLLKYVETRRTDQAMFLVEELRQI